MLPRDMTWLVIELVITRLTGSNQTSWLLSPFAPVLASHKFA
jgi:hypothetical protein